MSRFLYLVIVLGASKEALAAFSNPKEALKMVFMNVLFMYIYSLFCYIHLFAMVANS